MKMSEALGSKKAETYRYLNFDQYDTFTAAAKGVEIETDVMDKAKKSYAAFIA